MRAVTQTASGLDDSLPRVEHYRVCALTEDCSWYESHRAPMEQCGQRNGLAFLPSFCIVGSDAHHGTRWPSSQCALEQQAQGARAYSDSALLSVGGKPQGALSLSADNMPDYEPCVWLYPGYYARGRRCGHTQHYGDATLESMHYLSLCSLRDVAARILTARPYAVGSIGGGKSCRLPYQYGNIGII